MLSKYILSLAAAAGIASARPADLVKRQNIDTTVLQFALTLEHLENVFYKQALQNFTKHDFKDAGYSGDYYNDLKYIAHDEEEHVKLLSGALQAAGVTPNKACEYSFPYYDVRSFITLSSVLEGVGTSAYLGGAPLISSKDYLTVAGAILVAEAEHTSLQRLAISEVPIANPYGTPLDPTSVYTLAAMFITSCPPSNTPLPFTPYPALQLDGDTCTGEEPHSGDPSAVIKRNDKSWAEAHHGWPGAWHGESSNTCAPPAAGATVKFTAAGDVPEGSYVTFVSGLSVVSVPGTVDGKNISATIPAEAQGQTYVFVTCEDQAGKLKGDEVKFGPAILEVNPPAPQIDYSVL